MTATLKNKQKKNLSTKQKKKHNSKSKNMTRKPKARTKNITATPKTQHQAQKHENKKILKLMLLGLGFCFGFSDLKFLVHCSGVFLFC